MSNIKERFDALVQKFGDVELEAASTVLRHFFRQELLAMAQSLEKRRFKGTVGEVERGHNLGIDKAVAFIRDKASELV